MSTAIGTRRRGPFTALLTAYVISVAGTAMSDLAIPWLVLTTTGSAAKTGLVAFAEMAPYVLLQATAGPLVDRVGPRRAFVWGNLAAAIVVCAIPGLYAAGALSLGALAGLVAIAGAVRGAADCANAVLVPTTASVAGMPLERAAGLHSSANRTAILLGAPLAGVLISVFNAPAVVLIDGVTFAVAAVIVAGFVHTGFGHTAAGTPAATSAPAGTPAPAATPGPAATSGPVATPGPTDTQAPAVTSGPTVTSGPATTSGPTADRGIRAYGRELAEGFRFIRGDRLLLGIIAVIAVTNLLDQGLSTVLVPVWVREHLRSAAGFGLILGAGGIGDLAGSLLGAWLGPRLPRRLVFVVGTLVGGAPRFAVLALAGTLAPAMIVYAAAGIAGGSTNSAIGATLYDRIPTHLQARVLGAVKASAWVGIPFGALVAGTLADAAGVRIALAVTGAAYLAVSLAPAVFPAWRDMRRPPSGGVDIRARTPADDVAHSLSADG